MYQIIFFYCSFFLKVFHFFFLKNRTNKIFLFKKKMINFLNCIEWFHSSKLQCIKDFYRTLSIHFEPWPYFCLRRVKDVAANNFLCILSSAHQKDVSLSSLHSRQDAITWFCVSWSTLQPESPDELLIEQFKNSSHVKQVLSKL